MVDLKPRMNQRRRSVVVPVLLPILFLLAADPTFPSQPTPLETGFHQMYDLQFDQAHASFHSWMEQHPDDPLGPASDAAALLFSEFDRLHILQSELFLHDDAFFTRKKPEPDPNVKLQFEAELKQTQQLADRVLERDPSNANAQFASMMRMGLHSDYLALIEKKYVSSLAEVKASRSLAEKLLAANPNFADAYLAVGVENYLLSLKSAPVRWLLRVGGAETDRQRGIDNLTRTAQSGHLFPPYARVLLAVAAMRDKNVPRARELLEGLAKEFPHNPLYRQELARLSPR
jgi:hypothetical protein